MIPNRILILVLGSLLSAVTLQADLAREANKAAQGEGGELVAELGFLLEKEQSEHAYSLEFALQFVPEFQPRLSMLVEASLREWIHPEFGATTRGQGDTELSLFYLLLLPRGWRPAVVVGAQVKLPTAGEREIGSDKTDYLTSLALGQELGDVELNLELEYAFVTQPDPIAGAADPLEILQDHFLYTLAADYGLFEHFALYGEVAGNTRTSDLEGAAQELELGFELDTDLGEDGNVFLEVGFNLEGVFMPKIGIEWDW